MNEENKSWPKYQYECVQSFSDYTQGNYFIYYLVLIKYKYLARRSNNNREELTFDFYDIIFLVSQLRSLNRQISKSLMNIPWPYLQNLPSFFYRIYLPNISSILNSNYDTLSFSPIVNNTNHYQNHFIDINMSTNNLILPSNNETNFWTVMI